MPNPPPSKSYFYALGAFLLAAFASSGCTKNNPQVCCDTTADCDAIGFDEPQRCSEGDVCVANECAAFVPECAVNVDCTDPSAPFCVQESCVACDVTGDVTAGCTATEPVCDVASNTCGSCETRSDCTDYDGTPACGESGACVQCDNDTDCANPTPLCGDTGECKGCTTNDECDTGFCDDSTGACAAELDTIYVSPNGAGAICTKATPCKSAQNIVNLISSTRRYIQMAPGTYTEPLYLGGNEAVDVVIHGTGATIQATVSRIDLTDYHPILKLTGSKAVIRGLKFSSINLAPGAIIYTESSTLDLRDSKLENLVVGTGVYPQGIRSISSTLKLERVAMTRFYDEYAIYASGGKASINAVSISTAKTGIYLDTSMEPAKITNSYMARMTGPAVVASNTGVEVSFSSFFETGTQVATVGRGIACFGTISGTHSQHDNIIWSPSSNADVPLVSGSACFMERTIGGPSNSSLGLTNLLGDPKFIGVGDNLHLQPTSPAIDFVTPDDCTATADADGHVRPQGAGCEPGAFEFTP